MTLEEAERVIFQASWLWTAADWDLPWARDLYYRAVAIVLRERAPA